MTDSLGVWFLVQVSSKLLRPLAEAKLDQWTHSDTRGVELMGMESGTSAVYAIGWEASDGLRRPQKAMVRATYVIPAL